MSVFDLHAAVLDDYRHLVQSYFTVTDDGHDHGSCASHLDLFEQPDIGFFNYREGKRGRA
jgi:hypothetical protein